MVYGILENQQFWKGETWAAVGVGNARAPHPLYETLAGD